MDLYGTYTLCLSFSTSLLTMHSLVLCRPLGLDSRTPGIFSGPYDNALRTTCSRNEILMKRAVVQEEGQGSVLSHVRTSILWPINFVKMSSFLEGSSLVHRNPGTSLLFLTMLWSWSSLRSTPTHPTLYGALDHLGSPPIPKALEMSCTSSCFGFGSNLSDFG